MTHEVETMAYANEVPWHGLGVNVDPNVTPDEMLKAAGLDWEIERHPIYCKLEDRELRIPGQRALVRSSDHKVMSIVGQNWKPLQNREMLNFFKEYSEAGGAQLETAGSLRGGTIVWGLASLKDGFEASKGDRVNGYLLFKSPHKVGQSIRISTTTVRVVCANTMAMADRHGIVEYSQSHVNRFDFDLAKEQVEEAHEVLKLAGQRAKVLHKLKLSIAESTNLLAKFFGADELTEEDLAEGSKNPKHLDSVLNAMHNAPGAEPGTGWGVLNGVTYWADHMVGRTAATRMFRSWIGDTGKKKLQVEKALLELV